MNQLAKYLLTVIGTAMVCGALKNLLRQGSATGKILHLLSGVIMACAVFSPIISIFGLDNPIYLSDFSREADGYTAQGISYAKDAQIDIIRSRCTAYVLDKADALGLCITVELQLSDDPPYAPEQVTITGAASPYARGRLQNLIENDLAIPKEAQIWIES